MTTLAANADVLIAALTGLDHKTNSQDAACLALRALGHADLAKRYADAASRMSFWNSKPDHFEFAGTVFGGAGDTWTDEDVANHERDQKAYWALVSEIAATLGIEGE